MQSTLLKTCIPEDQFTSCDCSTTLHVLWIFYLLKLVVYFFLCMTLLKHNAQEIGASGFSTADYALLEASRPRAERRLL